MTILLSILAVFAVIGMLCLGVITGIVLYEKWPAFRSLVQSWAEYENKLP